MVPAKWHLEAVLMRICSEKCPRLKERSPFWFSALHFEVHRVSSISTGVAAAAPPESTRHVGGREDQGNRRRRVLKPTSELPSAFNGVNNFSENRQEQR